MGQIIDDTEKKWLNELYGYVKDLFSTCPVPSHDQDHHFRVWKYAAEFLRELAATGREVTHQDAENLIISCFFHDTGMIRENGPGHGNASREICEVYLNATTLAVHNRSVILQAVENHDDKSYHTSPALYSDKGLNISGTLAICDDLDAYGLTGVYRYAEIYILRGIPMEDLGLKIMANLSGRFANFISGCSSLPGMIRRHVIRHNETEDFFRDYNLQLRMIPGNASRPDTGPVGVVSEIFRQTMSGAESITEVCDRVVSTTNENYVLQFFTNLKNELAEM